MSLYKYRLTLIAAVVLFVCSWGYAAEIGFRCKDCHESVSKILPKEHVKKTAFEGCFDCHVDGGKGPKLGGKIHNVHFAQSEIVKDTCLSCHVADSEGNITVNSATGAKIDPEDGAEKFNSLYTKGKLVNSHKNAGLMCSDCHKTYDEDEADGMHKKCVECHGDFNEMMAKTAKAPYKANPHKSHFPNLTCTKCHSMHGDFKDYCVKCHQWGFVWKQKIVK